MSLETDNETYFFIWPEQQKEQHPVEFKSSRSMLSQGHTYRTENVCFFSSMAMTKILPNL